MLIFISAFAGYLFKIELEKKPIIKQKLDSNEIDYIYDFYTDAPPNHRDMAFLGDDDAPIKFVAYLDIASGSSKFFILSILPLLKENYIDKGIIKFYAKQPITNDDLKKHTDKFIYYKSLLCIREIKKEVYFKFYFDLYYNQSIDDISYLLDKHGISAEGYEECMRDRDFEAAAIDISETENFGIIGINPKFYIGIDGTDFTAIEGIPKFNRFNRTIKDYEILIGR
ncbi:hypothetical protein J4206_01830 [Candidatus Woesearchaeota archaeon]|nr:hypothetical protein [Candidatus Woesearchaeota archaeon]